MRQVPQHGHDPSDPANRQRGTYGRFCSLGTLKGQRLLVPESVAQNSTWMDSRDYGDGRSQSMARSLR